MSRGDGITDTNGSLEQTTESGSPRRKRSTKLTAAQKVERDTTVIALRAKGNTWPSIAQATGLSASQCREVHRLYLRDQVSVLGRRLPEDFIVEVLDEFDSVIQEMAAIREESTNAMTVVAACRTQLQASKSRVEFMQALGLLPSRPASINEMRELHSLVQEIADVLHEAGMPPEVEAEIIDIASRGPRRRSLSGPSA